MPNGRQLHGGEHALVQRRQRVALPALYAAGVQAEQTVSHGCSPLDQAILPLPGAQLGGDPLARLSIGSDHAQINKEQWAVLDIQATEEL
jgi:hypothetical protein